MDRGPQQAKELDVTEHTHTYAPERLGSCLACGQREMGMCYPDIVVAVNIGMEDRIEEVFW